MAIKWEKIESNKKIFNERALEYCTRAEKIKEVLARFEEEKQWSEEDKLLARLAKLRTPSSAAGMRFSLVGATCGLGSGMSNAMVTNALHFGPLLVRLHVASLTIYIHNALI